MCDIVLQQGFEADVTTEGHHLQVAAVQKHFQQALIQHGLREGQLLFFDTIDSTNVQAQYLLEQGVHTPLALLAAQQTAGLGRLGGVWASPAGGNIYLSLALRPQNQKPEGCASLGLWVALQVCHWLQTRLRVPCLVKWPNDLVIGRRKLGGLLLQTRLQEGKIRDLVIGIGLNAYHAPAQTHGISLWEETGRYFDSSKIAAYLAVQILLAYNLFTQGAHKNMFQDLLHKYHALVGLKMEYEGETVIIDGIDNQGALWVRRPDGTLVPIQEEKTRLKFFYES
jgi:BirA family biotin operon repressor/biotin-[acetyl-CoA-carboxylase] ligase